MSESAIPRPSWLLLGMVASGGGFGAWPTLLCSVLANILLALTADYTVILFPESYFQSRKWPSGVFLDTLVAMAQIGHHTCGKFLNKTMPFDQTR